MKYILFDSSRLNTLLTCPQKYEYTYEKNLRQEETESYLSIGSMIHLMLKTYYNTLKYRDRYIGTYKYEQLVESCIKIGEWYGIRNKISPDNIIHICNVMREYFEFYKSDPLMSEEIIGCEQYFALPLGNSLNYQDEDYQVILEGRIDLILMNKEGELRILDHKHESARRPFSRLRNQFLIYCLATETKKFTVNVIGTQKSKCDRFYRNTYYYDKDVITEFANDLSEVGKEYLQYKLSKKFPRHRNACDIYGICMFEKICSVSTELRETRLQQFITSEWSPFNEK